MTDERTPHFSDSHPHFTPRWLSEKLVGHVAKTFSGTVIDPACGAGNLLVAAALYLDAASKRSNDVQLFGVDVSKKAITACSSSLSSLLPNGNFAVEHGDFFAGSRRVFAGPTAVVMNPPFRGYGHLQQRTRRRIAHTLDMKGRFNLSYAFVQRAAAVYRPKKLVSLLPSNWIYSRGSAFRSELDALNGSWDWEDIGDRAFRGVNVHVGILVWRPKSKRARRAATLSPVPPPRLVSFDVRNGVATGRDAVFIEIAKDAPPFGTVVSAVRGKDVARGSSVSIWLPPEQRSASVATFRKHVGGKIAADLKGRYCVSTGRRQLYEYHESLPGWFIGEPKLLIPEIIVGRIRVQLDPYGTALPLHSVIAVRVPSIAMGKLLRAHLAGLREQRKMLANAPKLSGGAVRLQVGAVRDALHGWVRSRKRARR
ncbi:MAG: N-6 DNA methylase [Gemmatimonadaceae bacterium]|nr:N-6 DNA methylase [Gemmatimonadaceae bacterium]